MGLIAVATVPLLLALVIMHDNTPFSPFNNAWDGYSKAVECLKPSTSLRQFNAVVLIVEEEPSSGLVNELRRFLEGGGLLVVAGNRGVYVNALLRGLGVNASLGESVITDDFVNVNNNPRLPLALVVNHTYPFTNITVIALDDAVPLNPGNLTVVAETLSSSMAGGFRGPFPVIAMGKAYNGVIIVASSPAILMNTLLNFTGNGELLKAICNMGNAAYLPLLLKPIDVSYLKLAAWILINSGLLRLIIGPLLIVLLALPVIHVVRLNAGSKVRRRWFMVFRLMLPLVYIAFNLGGALMIYVVAASLTLLIIDSALTTDKGVDLALTLIHVPLTAILLPKPWSLVALVALIFIYHKQLSSGIRADWRTLTVPYPASALLAFSIDRWLGLTLTVFSIYLILLAVLRIHRLHSIKLRIRDSIVIADNGEFTLSLEGRLSKGVLPIVNINGIGVESISRLSGSILVKCKIRNNESSVNYVNARVTLIDETRLFKAVRELGKVTIVTAPIKPMVDFNPCGGTILVVPHALSQGSLSKLASTVLSLVTYVVENGCSSLLVIYDELSNDVVESRLNNEVNYSDLVKLILSKLSIINTHTLVGEFSDGSVFEGFVRAKLSHVLNALRDADEPVIVIGDAYFTQPLVDKLNLSTVIYTPTS